MFWTILQHYSKNPWPLGIRTFPNKVVLGFKKPPSWDVCDFSMAKCSCFYPLAVLGYLPQHEVFMIMSNSNISHTPVYT